jgi:hypothetical protein
MNPLLLVNCRFCLLPKSKRNIKRHEKKCFHNPSQFIFCHTCNKQLFQKKKFCNNSCAAGSTNRTRTIDRSYITEQWKSKISNKIKQKWKEGKLTYSQKRLFSSKNEREIVSYFKENFPADEWKSGGRLKISNEEHLSRDLWSDKLKICFEYDGIWHFKNIHGQLFKKQLKDRLLEQWCTENNYRLIRIDEEFYKNIQQIKELVYENQDPIIKIGNRY